MVGVHGFESRFFVSTDTSEDRGSPAKRNRPRNGLRCCAIRRERIPSHGRNTYGRRHATCGTVFPRFVRPRSRRTRYPGGNERAVDWPFSGVPTRFRCLKSSPFRARPCWSIRMKNRRYRGDPDRIVLKLTSRCTPHLNSLVNRIVLPAYRRYIPLYLFACMEPRRTWTPGRFKYRLKKRSKRRCCPY